MSTPAEHIAKLEAQLAEANGWLTTRDGQIEQAIEIIQRKNKLIEILERDKQALQQALRTIAEREHR